VAAPNVLVFLLQPSSKIIASQNPLRQRTIKTPKQVFKVFIRKPWTKMQFYLTTYRHSTRTTHLLLTIQLPTCSALALS